MANKIDMLKPLRPRQDRSTSETGGTYLNIDEVESALKQATSSPTNAFTELIPLPNRYTGKIDRLMLLRWAKDLNPIA